MSIYHPYIKKYICNSTYNQNSYCKHEETALTTQPPPYKSEEKQQQKIKNKKIKKTNDDKRQYIPYWIKIEE